LKIFAFPRAIRILALRGPLSAAFRLLTSQRIPSYRTFGLPRPGLQAWVLGLVFCYCPVIATFSWLHGYTFLLSPLATVPTLALYFAHPGMPINTIIVDDEKPARDELAFLLKAFPEIHLLAQGKNGLDAVNLIKEHNPDLVFLDVQMPGLDGFGVLQKLVERKLKVPHVVFATAFDHYAVQAFDVNAVDYVLKPFDKARISKAIQRVKREIESQANPTERLEQLVSQLAAPKSASSQPSKVLIRSQQRMLLVDSADLIFASIEGGLISVTARDIEGTSNYRTLDELLAALDPESFWRPHRSYLVNIHHIKEVVPWFKSSFMIKMNDKKQSEIPVSRQQTKRLRDLFNL
jgi:two-component system, LytTR family, response regulator LytT